MEKGYPKASAGRATSDHDFEPIWNEIQNRLAAGLRQGIVNPPANFVKVVIDLTTASTNPLYLPSPLKSVYVQTATDSTCQVKLIANTDAQFAIDSGIPLSINDAITFGSPVPKAYLAWTAQSGKSITLYCAIDAEMRPGKIVSVSSGGVTLSEGDSVTTGTGAQVTAVAAALFAASTTRKKVLIQNQSSQDIWLGDSAVTTSASTKPGIKVQAGGSYEWLSSAACYAIAAGSTGANDISLTTFS